MDNATCFCSYVHEFASFRIGILFTCINVSQRLSGKCLCTHVEMLIARGYPGHDALLSFLRFGTKSSDKRVATDRTREWFLAERPIL
jgi:hypothetical protein